MEILTRYLVEGDILCEDLLDSAGKILLRNGTKLNKMHISKIKEIGMHYAAIEHSVESENIVKLALIRDTIVDAVPEFFQSVLSGDKNKIDRQISIVDDMIEYITKTGEINTSIFDLKEYDEYTYIHCVNTSIMATYIGVQLNINPKELKSLALGAILHDIGKIQMPISILNKKEKLTLEEFNEVKKHPKNGYEILKGSGISDRIILDIVREHHERVDGTGYPFNLNGDQISEYAKIASVCDVFTALSANRSYRDRFNPNNAYEFILTENNKMFDNKVVEIFKNSFAIYSRGCRVKLSNGLEGIVVGQNKGFPDRPIVKVNEDSNEYEVDLLKNINLTII